MLKTRVKSEANLMFDNQNLKHYRKKALAKSSAEISLSIVTWRDDASLIAGFLLRKFAHL